MENQTLENQAASRNGVKRMLFAVFCLLLEIGFWFWLFNGLADYAPTISIVLRVVALILVLILFGQKKTASIKMPWIMLILSFPFFGVFLYLLIGLNGHTRTMKHSYAEADALLFPMLPKNEAVRKEMQNVHPEAAGIAEYLYRNAHFPAYHDTAVEYYAQAADGLEAQLTELAKAQHFIFMEYHAIENKESWHRILAVLEDRVKAGVEVRVFYDDLGSIGFINTDFVKVMQDVGIQCRVFNPFTPGLNIFLNNRDHRKITVIDGRIGFTGGYNLANEYFGVTHPYGEWKDTGIKLTGPAVQSLTVMFLEMWNAMDPKQPKDAYPAGYLPEVAPVEGEGIGFTVPYADSPLDDLHVGEDVYISMLNKANCFCWFATPYLILSDEMISALNGAAMRGVDVRIITPGIPDKKMVYKVTRSFYLPLVKSGVRIYEWAPGFSHAKMSLCDGCMATCGTINLDYRSLYHHFENGCFFADCPAVEAMQADFENTFAQCREVTEIYRSGVASKLGLGQLFLRLFAGLL